MELYKVVRASHLFKMHAVKAKRQRFYRVHIEVLQSFGLLNLSYLAQWHVGKMKKAIFPKTSCAYWGQQQLAT